MTEPAAIAAREITRGLSISIGSVEVTVQRQRNPKKSRYSSKYSPKYSPNYSLRQGPDSSLIQVVKQNSLYNNLHLGVDGPRSPQVPDLSDTC
jgi:hypothetical protein